MTKLHTLLITSLFLISFCLLFLTGCGDSSSQKLPKHLAGKWKWVAIQDVNGPVPTGMFGESTIEFTKEGEMIKIEDANEEPVTRAFSVAEGKIISEEGTWTIDTLTKKKFVYSALIDQVEFQYVFEKVKD